MLILVRCTLLFHSAFWWVALGQKIISSTLIRAKAVTLIPKVPTSTSSISVAAAVVALLRRGAHFLC